MSKTNPIIQTLTAGEWLKAYMGDTISPSVAAFERHLESLKTPPTYEQYNMEKSKKRESYNGRET